MKMQAYEGADLVPMAVPGICWYNLELLYVQWEPLCS